MDVNIFADTESREPNGAATYKETMDSLRSATYRKRKETTEQSTPPLRKIQKTNALVPVEEFVVDDWFQEDLVSTSAAKPSSFTRDIFSTSGFREDISKFSRKNSKEPRKRKPVEFIDHDGVSVSFL